MMNRILRVAWITYFPVEWLPEAPEEIRVLPKAHPASWQRVLLRELQKDTSIELHVFSIRKTYPRDFVFTSGNTTFHCLRAPGGLRAPSLFWVDTWLLKPHIRRIRPDVMHAWGTELASGLVASRIKVPYLLTMQGMLGWLDERVKLNRYEKLMVILERHALPKSPLVTVEAKFAVDYISSRWPGTPVQQIEHAPDPLFAQTPRTNDPAKLRILAMGGINEMKGGDLLLRCLARLESQTPFEVVSIGSSETPLMAQLRAELPASLFERITF